MHHRKFKKEKSNLYLSWAKKLNWMDRQNDPSYRVDISTNNWEGYNLSKLKIK